jgi:secondary thiamine-phosphate synthase enzyme
VKKEKEDLTITDITYEVEKAISASGAKNGNATVFIVGSTAGVTTIEHDPNLFKDFSNAVERIAPSGIKYEHVKTWGDDNGKSHIRASLLGPSLVVPFIDKKPILGTWQQIVVADFDIPKRNRRVVLQIIGE